MLTSVLTALALFLLDVFVRRVLVGWGDLAAGLAVAWRWTVSKVLPGRAAPAEGLSSQSLKAKESATAAQTLTETDRDGFLDSLKRVNVDRSPVAPPAPRPRGPLADLKDAPGTTDGDAQEKKAPDSFTGQLLQARSRARRKMDQGGRQGADNGQESKPSEGDREP